MFKTIVDCSGRHLTPAGKKREMGDPTGKKPRRLPPSPRKASDWSGKERTTFIIKNNNLCENSKNKS
jgi:hypothetical protein